MPTATKKSKEAAKRSAASKKAAATRKRNEAKRAKAADPGPKVPQPFDDLHTAEDSQGVPGHFVEVVRGEHKGRYGVIVDRADDTHVVLRSRDADTARLVVKYADVEPAEAGRR